MSAYLSNVSLTRDQSRAATNDFHLLICWVHLIISSLLWKTPTNYNFPEPDMTPSDCLFFRMKYVTIILAWLIDLIQLYYLRNLFMVSDDQILQYV